LYDLDLSQFSSKVFTSEKLLDSPSAKCKKGFAQSERQSGKQIAQLAYNTHLGIYSCLIGKFDAVENENALINLFDFVSTWILHQIVES
jgi:hypothetical protein